MAVDPALAARRRSPMRWIAAGVFAVAVLAVCGSLNVSRVAGGVKGDEASYVSMAQSLAYNGDLKFRREDLDRFRAAWGTGPEGIFLKTTTRVSWHLQAGWPVVVSTREPVPWEEGLDYGKSFAYSVVAAPFVRVLGLGGMLGLNILFLCLSTACAVVFCRARLRGVAGTVMGLVFVGASVVPVYGVWLTPEMFNLTLVFVAYFLWLYKEVAPPDVSAGWRRPSLDWVAAFLLGVATFSKPTNGPLVAPLLLTMLWRRQWKHTALVLGCFALGSVGLFAVNSLVAGSYNYQGGDRRTFYSHFPFDGDGTAFSHGAPMATEEANDQSILAPSYLFPRLRDNLYYFLVGRDAGFVPYFFPGVVIGLWWLLRVRRAPIWQWAIAAGAAASILGLLVLAPETWNGGGGPVGNRYALSIYPPLLFLLPIGTSLMPAVASALAGATFLGPILINPFAASREVWHNPARWPLHLLPVELTIMNQLPVALSQLRSHISVNEDPEVLLYYMDENTYYQEPRVGPDPANCDRPCNFWVHPGRADIVVRTEQPLSTLTMTVKSSVANEVDVSLGGEPLHRLTLEKDKPQTIVMHPKPGVYAYKSWQLVWSITTANGFHPQDSDLKSGDTRYLGAFITPKYEVTAPH